MAPSPLGASEPATVYCGRHPPTPHSTQYHGPHITAHPERTTPGEVRDTASPLQLPLPSRWSENAPPPWPSAPATCAHTQPQYTSLLITCVISECCCFYNFFTRSSSRVPVRAHGVALTRALSFSAQTSHITRGRTWTCGHPSDVWRSALAHWCTAPAVAVAVSAVAVGRGIRRARGPWRGPWTVRSGGERREEGTGGEDRAQGQRTEGQSARQRRGRGGTSEQTADGTRAGCGSSPRRGHQAQRPRGPL